MDQAPDDLADLLHSDAWSQDHLLALGRLVELSAVLELYGRLALGEALPMDDRFGEYMALGLRMPQIAGQLQAVAHRDDGPSSAHDLADWAARAATAIGRRDAIVHRAPMTTWDGSGAPGVPGMFVARRNQRPEHLDNRVLVLLRDMLTLIREVEDLLRLERD